MKIKVRATAIPDDVDYLTAGKIYLCDLSQGVSGKGGTIVGDKGATLFIFISHCAHLDLEPWEIIPEEHTKCP